MLPWVWVLPVHRCAWVHRVRRGWLLTAPRRARRPRPRPPPPPMNTTDHHKRGNERPLRLACYSWSGRRLLSCYPGCGYYTDARGWVHHVMCEEPPDGTETCLSSTTSSTHTTITDPPFTRTMPPGWTGTTTTTLIKRQFEDITITISSISDGGGAAAAGTDSMNE